MQAPDNSNSTSSSSAKVVTNGEVNDVIIQEGDSRFKEIKVGHTHSFLTGLLKIMLWKRTSFLAIKIFLIFEIK
jgi:hypothetical protein